MHYNNVITIENYWMMKKKLKKKKKSFWETTEQLLNWLAAPFVTWLPTCVLGSQPSLLGHQEKVLLGRDCIHIIDTISIVSVANKRFPPAQFIARQYIVSLLTMKLY